uniref:Glutathione peroxidase n=1 Tax=Alexandrium monilatum TaxID=311494 RepID=A0A7S4S2V3_9DINO|mmetsp:Transcript_41559/g.129505  ORF Transcript_41559/g.129505 Transcript_41559/m.129505 type:complete len:194 (+) Transcript_41559:235-816(+)
MLTRMQKKYAGSPVRFILVPCNQFGSQEPKANAEVKAFAEQYVQLGPGSNVVMLAKSSLNGVPCAARGADVCTPASGECCPQNDGVYDYLLGATAPGTIKWNFDKIVVSGLGEPFHGETVLHGGDLDAALDAYIARAGAAVSAAAAAPGRPWRSLGVLALLGCAAAALALRLRRGLPQQNSAGEDSKAYFIMT